jgi:hypothetical protein
LDRALGATSSPCSKFHPNSRFQKETILNFSNSKPRSFSKFSIEIYSESEEVSMEKVVHPSESFKTIFYYKFFGLKKAIFGSVKV